ncbi:hypothetical protein FB45DRAFT_1054201 [Roridomyces roridus]|uniref:Uncharacterized protein n=1 Tax=Roridomyces roridus TaxID=1738132 RepID=A0AAD7C8J6_9AGAR|nr:hypothetical protein FB45DRAFT_1054201 [Roridomyces roridus]
MFVGSRRPTSRPSTEFAGRLLAVSMGLEAVTATTIIPFTPASTTDMADPSKARNALRSALRFPASVATSVFRPITPPRASRRSAKPSTISQGVKQLPVEPTTVYESLILVVESLYDCSDMFLPLKSAAGIILTVCKLAERVSDNTEQLSDLAIKLKSILSVVQHYKAPVFLLNVKA